MRYDKVLHIRVTEKEWKGIVLRAANKEMPISEYLRTMIDIGEKVDYSNRHTNNSEW